MTGINWFVLGCRLEEEEEENEEEGPEAEVNHAHAEHQNGGTPPDVWVPVALGLGLPLSPDKLCIAVCGRAGASNFLEVCFAGCPPSRRANKVGRYSRKEKAATNCPKRAGDRARCSVVLHNCLEGQVLCQGTSQVNCCILVLGGEDVL